MGKLASKFQNKIQKLEPDFSDTSSDDSSDSDSDSDVEIFMNKKNQKQEKRAKCDEESRKKIEKEKMEKNEKNENHFLYDFKIGKKKNEKRLFTDIILYCHAYKPGFSNFQDMMEKVKMQISSNLHLSALSDPNFFGQFRKHVDEYIKEYNVFDTISKFFFSFRNIFYLNNSLYDF